MSEFVSSGKKEQPSLYGETQMLHGVSELDDRILEEKARHYATLSSQDLMPRARAQVERLLAHFIFELKYRDVELERQIQAELGDKYVEMPQR